MTNRILLTLFTGLALTACGSNDSGNADGAPEPGPGMGVPSADANPGATASGGAAGSDATETNVAPAPCDTGADCPEGIACVAPDGGDGPGFCDVNEMVASGSSSGSSSPGGASLGAPAPCDTDTDCPEGIACVGLDGGGGPGFCDVNEMVAGGSP